MKSSWESKLLAFLRCTLLLLFCSLIFSALMHCPVCGPIIELYYLIAVHLLIVLVQGLENFLEQSLPWPVCQLIYLLLGLAYRACKFVFVRYYLFLVLIYEAFKSSPLFAPAMKLHEALRIFFEGKGPSSYTIFDFLSSQYSQTYFALTVYLFLAIALCGLLAGLAYLFSISTAQETEKRSEYECGFAPFDSATRLPFDVHFYLVGILFLIFDVEVALLFPWVLSLRTVGWFGFYLMFAFLFILSIGFLYEWRRGALIWPTRYSKAAKRSQASTTYLLLSVTTNMTLTEELFHIVTTFWPAMFASAMLSLRLAAWMFTRVRTKYTPKWREIWFTLYFAAGVSAFFVSLSLSYYLAFALAFSSCVGFALESNPVFPHKAYYRARTLLFSLPFLVFRNPLRAAYTFWSTFFKLIFWAGVWFTAWDLVFLTPLLRKSFKSRGRKLTWIEWYDLLPHKVSDFYGVLKRGFRLSIETFITSTVNSICNLLSFVTENLRLYDTFAAVLIFLVTYTVIYAYFAPTGLSVGGKTYRHDYQAATVFGVNKAVLQELLVVFLLLPVWALLFTNLSVYLGITVSGEYYWFIHHMLFDFFAEGLPQFVIFVAPNLIFVVLPAFLLVELPALLYADITYFLYTLLPNFICLKLPHIPGHTLQAFLDTVTALSTAVSDLFVRAVTLYHELIARTVWLFNKTAKEITFRVNLHWKYRWCVLLIPIYWRALQFVEYNANPYRTYLRGFFVYHFGMFLWTFVVPFDPVFKLIYRLYIQYREHQKAEADKKAKPAQLTESTKELEANKKEKTQEQDSKTTTKSLVLPSIFTSDEGAKAVIDAASASEKKALSDLIDCAERFAEAAAQRPGDCDETLVLQPLIDKIHGVKSDTFLDIYEHVLSQTTTPAIRNTIETLAPQLRSLYNFVSSCADFLYTEDLRDFLGFYSPMVILILFGLAVRNHSLHARLAGLQHSIKAKAAEAVKHGLVFYPLLKETERELERIYLATVTYPLFILCLVLCLYYFVENVRLVDQIWALEKEVIKQEEAKKESLKNAAAKKDESNKEEAKKDDSSKESNKKDAAKNGTVAKEAAKKEDSDKTPVAKTEEAKSVESKVPATKKEEVAPAEKATKALTPSSLLVDNFTETLAPLKQLLTSIEAPTLSMVPETLLFVLICGILIYLATDLGKAHNKRLLARTAWQAFSFGFLLISLVYVYQFFFVPEEANIIGGYFATSRTTTVLKLVTLLSALFVLDASETFMRRHERHLLEYPLMLALTTFFMLLLVSANHVMSSFLSLVGFSLGLYVLILYDANQRPSREAGLKYYYLSTLSSGFILYGLLLIYSLTGAGNFYSLFEIFSTKIFVQDHAIIRLATIFILGGFFFKLSAFPGHLWAADVYEGSPAPVTAFFMLPVKIAVLGGFIRLFTVAFAPMAGYWLPVLTVAVIISILWGAFASVQEKKVRRFLAYASINQMGFLLMGLTTDSTEGFRAALIYILVYAVMTCAFLTIFLSSRREDGSELLYISDFRTLASRNWLVGWSLAIVLFSMAGIPPLGGFFAKYFVLLHAFEKGLMLEVIVGLATSLISTYYYLRIIKTVKFEQPDGGMPSYPALTSRRQAQLFTAEALLWSFVVFAPAILGLMYTLVPDRNPDMAAFF